MHTLHIGTTVQAYDVRLADFNVNTALHTQRQRQLPLVVVLDKHFTRYTGLLKFVEEFEQDLTVYTLNEPPLPLLSRFHRIVKHPQTCEPRKPTELQTLFAEVKQKGLAL